MTRIYICASICEFVDLSESFDRSACLLHVTFENTRRGIVLLFLETRVGSE
jgi:hypothetical protein